MRLRPKLAAACAKSGPITTPRLSEGGGPDARTWANQALAASVSSCHANVRKPVGSIAARVAAALKRKLVAGVRAHGTG
jgi:organic hydroperoxide reductase OsmC/OhrA